MKTIRNLALALTLIAGVVFSGCKKSNNDNPSPGSNGTMSLKHEGQAWAASLSGQSDTYSATGVIGSGEVTFTELTDKKAKGTFKFTAYNTAQAKVGITEGKFNVSF